MLALYPGDTQAREGIVTLYRTYLERAEQTIEVGDFEHAGKLSPTNERYIDSQAALIAAQETASADSDAGDTDNKKPQQVVESR